MKNIVRTTGLGITFLTTILGLSVYGQSNQPRTIALDPATDARPANPVMEAMQFNIAEIGLGKLAVEKGTAGHVKAYASMIVKDNIDTFRKLRAVRGAPLGEIKPSPKQQAAFARLAKMFGDQFDREFTNLMISDHRDALSFLQNQSRVASPAITGEHPQLAQIAVQLIPAVQQHLQEAKQIQGELTGFLETETPRQSPNVFLDIGTAPSAGPAPFANPTGTDNINPAP